jgi:hypothetical protein
MHIEVDNHRVRVVPRPGMPPIFDEVYPTEEEANEAAQGIAEQLRSIDKKRQEESQRRWRESNERFIARLKQRRSPKTPIIQVPERREPVARPREHRAPRRVSRSAASRGDPSEPDLAEQLTLDKELTENDGLTFGEWVESLPLAPRPERVVRARLTREERLYLKLEVDRRRRELLATRAADRKALFNKGSA